MSGGSLNYVYNTVNDAAETIEMRATCPEHRAFASHLYKVATALHDIEWVFSSDYSEGAEIAAINACLDKSMVIEAATRDAERAMRELSTLLGVAKESTAECAHEYTEVATVLRCAKCGKVKE